MMQQILGQVVTNLAERPRGTLPSQPEQNPKGKGVYEASPSNQNVNAITTLRSGRKVDNKVDYIPEQDNSFGDDSTEESQPNLQMKPLEEVENESTPTTEKEIVPPTKIQQPKKDKPISVEPRPVAPYPS
ncbi:hypothetical protein FRX31_025510, partial [Thalictrum thalictroides]